MPKKPERDFSWFAGKVDKKLIQEVLLIEKRRAKRCPVCGRVRREGKTDGR